ncbi:MAG: hypothetical protein ACE5ER_12655, partial [Nitrospinaceae bacterium]
MEDHRADGLVLADLLDGLHERVSHDEQVREAGAKIRINDRASGMENGDLRSDLGVLLLGLADLLLP